MNIYIKLLKLTLFVFALVGSQSAFAVQGDAAAATGLMSQIISMPYDSTDLAHRSLAQIFGGFIFEPFGGAPAFPTTALSTVLGYTNIIALILGVVITVWVLIQGLVNTAMHGEVMGKSWSSVWISARTVTAFGLLIPGGGDGTFSVIQKLVMSLIIIGSNAGTWLWQQGVTSLQTGSPVMAVNTMHTGRDVNEYAKIFMCAAAHNKLIIERDKEADDGAVTITAKTNVTTTYANSMAAYKAAVNVVSINFENCGVITSPQSSEQSIDGTAEEKTNSLSGGAPEWSKTLQKNYNSATSANFPNLLSATKGFADYMVASDLNEKRINSMRAEGKGDKAIIEAEIAVAAGKLQTLSSQYDSYVKTVQNATVTGDVVGDWGSRMTKGGWIMAGAWFFESSRLQGFAQTLLGGSLGTGKYTNDGQFDGGCAFAKFFGSSCEALQEQFNSSIVGLKTVVDSPVASPINSQSSAGGGLSRKVDLAEANGTIGVGVTKTFSVIISQLILDSVMSWGSDDAIGTGGNTGSTGAMSSNVTGMISPFTAVTSIGRGLQQVSVIAWSAGAAAAGVIGGLEGAGKGIVGITAELTTGGAANIVIGGMVAIAKYVMSTLSPVVMGIAAMAFMLAFAIPFMPVTIWIMQICGYFVTVVEAVAAAPLAVIMLATPEGDGITGTNFNKAIQMVNSIVLKPSLSIVALFAAITLSYVGFMILNTLFWIVAGLNTSGSLFEIMAILFIYTTACYKMNEYMIQVIYKIPNQILGWMGGGEDRAFGENDAANGVSGALNANAASGGLAIGAGMSSLKGGVSAMKERAQAKARADQASAAANPPREG